MSLQICKWCMGVECIDCEKGEKRCNYGLAEQGGITGLSECGHSREWTLFLCTDCKYESPDEFVTLEQMKLLLKGGCDDGFHKFADQIEAPLTLTHYPGAKQAEVEGFKCVVCGCTGHMTITPRSVQWLDKAEQESIERHMFQEEESA